MPFRMIWGDIAAMETDAVVNAAYPTLRGGADGVHGDICRAAGREALEAALAAIGWCDVGDAVVTPGFGLAARHIIHAVGPQWRGGAYGERELLAQTYRRVLELAEGLQAHTLAVPLLSVGSFGFPTGVALDVAVAEIGAYQRAHEGLEVTLVLDSGETRRLPDPLHGRLSEYLRARYAENAPEVPLRPVGAQRRSVWEQNRCGTEDRREEERLAALLKRAPPDTPAALDAAMRPVDARKAAPPPPAEGAPWLTCGHTDASARYATEMKEGDRPVTANRRAGSGCLLLAIPRMLGMLLFWLVAGALFAVTWPFRALWRLLRGVRKRPGGPAAGRRTAQMPAPDGWREALPTADKDEAAKPLARSDVFASEDALFLEIDVPQHADEPAAPDGIAATGRDAPSVFAFGLQPTEAAEAGDALLPGAARFSDREAWQAQPAPQPTEAPPAAPPRQPYGIMERVADREVFAPMSAPAAPPEGTQAARQGAASLAERQRGNWERVLERQHEKRLRADAAQRRVAEAARARTLQDAVAHLGDTFSQAVLRLIDRRGERDVDVYKRANLTRQLFSKLRGDVRYQPSKQTAVALCVALELNLDDALDLLARAGYTLSACNRADLIAAYFIEHGIYDVFQLNEALFAFDEPCLGA